MCAAEHLNKCSGSRIPLWAKRFAMESLAKLVLGLIMVDTAPLCGAVFIFLPAP
jgi:hypothetical protein